MTRALIVTIGGGRIAEGETLHIEQIALQWLDKRIPKVVLLPPYTPEQEQYGRKLEEYWTGLGAKVRLLMLRDLADVDARVADALHDADYVYFGGGSFAWYANLLARSRVKPLLQKVLVMKRIVLSGISAGAFWFNPSSISPHYGIGLLPEGIGVAVHAQNPGRIDQLGEWASLSPTRVGYGICDKAAILFHSQSIWKQIGSIIKVKGDDA
ncbi:Type 1 glutamine amidotransferase-like domain-containing protein [Cohnella laeviribosi]|uniref:Type 1 glutamine amidotransferase-like domain-containing protein n=1 Tax=Cohnella laeviribosi TaxID=380174 RepID=UPI000378505D|nr:Type 1 glutamine amidotransferase-like domain-containing protein [Cohnella laeviribosi]